MTNEFVITSDFKSCISRLYWLDGTLIKSSATNGSDIKSLVITVGATSAFAFKVMKILKNLKAKPIFLFGYHHTMSVVSNIFCRDFLVG